jgi:hypothetical protein
MGKVYKSARGKMIDMDKVKIANESTVAVGNMKVNARGDIIGNNGQVALGRNQIMDQVYAVPTAEVPGFDATAAIAQEEAMSSAKAQALADLANNLVQKNNNEIETDTNTLEPAARGNLAGAVAKTKNVTQEPAPDLRNQAKSNGPSRI